MATTRHVNRRDRADVARTCRETRARRLITRTEQDVRFSHRRRVGSRRTTSLLEAPVPLLRPLSLFSLSSLFIICCFWVKRRRYVLHSFIDFAHTGRSYIGYERMHIHLSPPRVALFFVFPPSSFHPRSSLTSSDYRRFMRTEGR